MSVVIPTMTMANTRLPTYRLHRKSGQGYTEHRKKSYYFGEYGTAESKQKFARFLASIANGQPPVLQGPVPGSELIVAELVNAFLDHAAVRYVKDGKPTTEPAAYRVAVAPLVALYGGVTPTEFGPVALEQVRQTWVKAGLTRKTVNKYAARVVRIWKWGVGRQLVPVTAWQALTALEALRAGQGVSRPKVKPAEESMVRAIQPFVSRQVWALIQYQSWTGCRPHEACQVRMADIDRSHEIWEHRPRRFKTEHHGGAERVVYLGPHAQTLVLEWERKNPEELLWQPRDARREWLAAHGSKAASKGTHQAGEQYTSGSYGRAVEHGCERAFGMPREFKRGVQLPPGTDLAAVKAAAAAWRREHVWSPNQLRHTAATRIRAEYGIETARIILGHEDVSTTAIYAEQDREQARRAVRDSG